MKNCLTIILLFCFGAVSYSQESYVKLSISPETIEKGDQFTIEIRTNVPGKLSIDNLPASFNLIQYSEGSSITTLNPDSGDLEVTLVSTYTGSIDAVGNYTIGPAFVTSGRGSFSSNQVKLTVEEEMTMYSGEISMQQLKEPAFGVIQTSKKSIYEGEPLIASSKIYSKVYGRILDPKSYTLQGALDNHPLGDPNRLTVREEMVKGIHLYSYEFDKQLIFPTGAGKLKIEPFEAKFIAQFQKVNIKSTYAIVDIIPLPANPPSDFIGGVGEFSVSRSADVSNLKQGDVFKMTVVIEGEGNLQNTTKPKINLPKGFIIYGDPIVKENYRFNSKGCNGSISYEYNIQVTNHGKQELPPVNISYFDVDKEKYVNASSKSLSLNIRQNDNYVDSQQSDEQKSQGVQESRLPLLKEKHIVRQDSFFGTPGYWAGIGAPVLSALLFLLFRTVRTNREEKLEQERVIQLAENEISAHQQRAAAGLNSADEDMFYSNVEAALRKAFALKIYPDEPDHMVRKAEIFNYALQHYGAQVMNKVKEIFDTCEQSRFGLTGTDKDRSALLNELNEVISDIQ